MSAGSSERLADALEDAGCMGLAIRARGDEFHDRLSPHDAPLVVLVDELRKHLVWVSAVLDRVAAGEFDAERGE